MSKPSQWPLTFDAVRFVLPHRLVQTLAQDPVSLDCYLLALGYYPRASGHFMRRPRHDDHLLIFCADGKGEFETAHCSGHLLPGQALFLPRGIAHSYVADNRTPWTIYWCHFDGASSRDLIDRLNYSRESPVIDIGLEPQLIGDFKRLLAIPRRSTEQHGFIHASSILRQLLSFMVVKISENANRDPHGIDLEAIESIMLNSVHSRLCLDDLAATSHLSRHHFAAKYKTLTGMPPITHFIHLKMGRACQLLDTTHLSIKEISARLGYEDALYFSRQFRKVIGLSPSDYRSKRRG